MLELKKWRETKRHEDDEEDEEDDDENRIEFEIQPINDSNLNNMDTASKLFPIEIKQEKLMEENLATIPVSK